MRSSVLPSWAGRSALAAAITPITVLVLFFCGFMSTAFEWRPVGGSAESPSPGSGSLPARVGAPSPWTADARTAPIGAASVLYTSNTWFPDGSGWLAGLVGRDDDVYRVTESAGAAGMASVLSPDGARLASPDGIVDLATGRVTAYRDLPGEKQIQAQAWSPEGTSVVLLAGEWAGGPPTSDVPLLIADAGSGATREVARLRGNAPLAGWVAAFSPDGSRLAFSHGEGVRILTLAGGATVDVPLPAGARPAGKGAWTPDGRNLLVVSAEECDCGRYPMRWTVRAVSATDGAVTGPVWSRDGVYALRVVGWWPSGQPVAVEYTPVGHAVPTRFATAAERDVLVSQDHIAAARLIELGTSRPLLEADGFGAAGDVESLDVPDRVLAAGVVRPGDPPLFDLDLLVAVPVAVVAAALLVLVILAVWWLIARLVHRPRQDRDGFVPLVDRSRQDRDGFV